MVLADEIADLGPRLPSTAAHDDARALLADAWRVSALETDPSRPHAERHAQRRGLVTGADPELGEIVLAAHYDTVADSPGAADDAGGCAVVLGVVQELARAPLRRSLRVVFFDGEEAGLLGSGPGRSAGAGRPRSHSREPPSGRDRRRSRGRSGRCSTWVERRRPTVPSARRRGWSTPRSRPGAAVDFPFRVGDHVAPIRAQILTRTARVPWSSDAVALLEAGIPSIVLTDFSALHPYDAMHTPDDVPGRLAPTGCRAGRWRPPPRCAVSMLSTGGRAGRRSTWPSPDASGSARSALDRPRAVDRAGSARHAGAVGRSARRRAARAWTLLSSRLSVPDLVSARRDHDPALAAPLLYPLAPLGMITPRSTAVPGGSRRARLSSRRGVARPALRRRLAGLASGFALAPGKVVLVVSTLATFGWQLWTRSTPGRDRAGAAGRSRADRG